MKQAKTNKTLIMILLCLFVVLISVSSASAASTVYVNATGGNDSNTGTIDHPYQTIGQGINSVDENGTVTIADGTYSGTGNTNLTINKSMNIIGQSQKGTIISGTDTNQKFTDTNWIFKINKGITVNIQNLTITHGKAGCKDEYGDPECGTIYNKGTISMSDCTFTYNSANNGGVIYNDKGTITSMILCTFKYNRANNGGVIYNNYGTIIDYNGIGSTFLGNDADHDGGVIYNYCGTINMVCCSFLYNTAKNRGGALYNVEARVMMNLNWWGSSAGPQDGQISGNGYVNYSPWLSMRASDNDSNNESSINPIPTLKPTNTTNTVNAATQTIAMQPTGIPLAGLALAILAISGGILPRRKQ